uniref:Uncharacterized protein n=1 Tax=Leptobrachium leishanense TaxID=445787 RepID=A0A8C5WJE8_9ANUR
MRGWRKARLETQGHNKSDRERGQAQRQPSGERDTDNYQERQRARTGAETTIRRERHRQLSGETESKDRHRDNHQARETQTTIRRDRERGQAQRQPSGERDTDNYQERQRARTGAETTIRRERHRQLSGETESEDRRRDNHQARETQTTIRRDRERGQAQRQPSGERDTDHYQVSGSSSDYHWISHSTAMYAAQKRNPLLEGLSCGVCLQTLQDPVSITCGHTFCRKCITQYWQTPTSQGFLCPECRKSCRRNQMTPNYQLASLISHIHQEAVAPNLATGPEVLDDDFAVPLVGVDEDGRLILNESSLRVCFQNSEAKEALNCHVVLISVIGEKRRGKSFLMNYIIRALKSKEKNKKLTLGESEEPLQGFTWRPGTDAITKGLWMWRRPFILSRGGRKIAVFVMDTEGSLDIESKREACIKISALSMLLSSHLIFNVENSLKETELDYMEMYLHMAEESGSLHGQHQDILIRDWHDAKKCSASDAESYIKEEILKIQKSKHYKKTSSGLSDKHTKCFLLPHPGKHITAESEGRLSDMDKDFQEGLVTYIHHVVQGAEKRLKINEDGLVLTRDIPPMIEELVKKLNSLKYNFSSPVEMFYVFQNQKLKDETVKGFQEFLNAQWACRFPSSMDTIVSRRSSELVVKFTAALMGPFSFHKDMIADLEKKLLMMQEKFHTEYKIRLTGNVATLGTAAGFGFFTMTGALVRGATSVATSAMVAFGVIPSVQKGVPYLAGRFFQRGGATGDPTTSKKKV